MIYLFRIYQWLIAAPILLILTILTALVTIIGSSLGGSQWWGYYPPKLWSKCVCLLWMIRVKVVGKENIDNKTSYVFAANHQGAFDIWSIYGYLGHNFKWLMKKSLEKVPFVGYACKCAGNVFVDDSSIAGIKETISHAEKSLKNGMSLVIFPEGTRTHDGKIQNFKRGAFMLASEFALPVVPITINGSFKAMPRSTYNVTPTTIQIVIHKPIYPGEKGFSAKTLMSQCYEQISSSLSNSE